MSNLIVADVQIRQDAEGRYCLNDLHKAAGGERRHDTREFMSRASTAELVRELESEMTGISVNTQRGRYGGTWPPKLAVFFARWLDAKGAVRARGRV